MFGSKKTNYDKVKLLWEATRFEKIIHFFKVTL